MAFPLRIPTIGITGWGSDVNQNWTDIEEMLTGLQPIPGLELEGDVDMLGHELFDVEDIEITGDWHNLAVALDTRYYTQEQVLDLIAGAGFNYYLSDTADGVIGGYNRMYPADTGEVQSTIGPITIDADPKLIQSFITSIDQPDFTVLSEGVYQLNIHASSTIGANIKDARIQWRLYRRTQPGGVETLLTTSEEGDILTVASVHYNIHAIVPDEVNLAATDRLVLKVYGVREGAEPQNPDVTVYLEGDTSSRIEIRTTLSSFDARYLLLDGENEMAADLDMGAHAIVDVGNIDGVDVSALKVDVDEFPDQLKQLLTVEIQQLENIGATTISAAQWGWVGAMAAAPGNVSAAAVIADHKYTRGDGGARGIQDSLSEETDAGIVTHAGQSGCKVRLAGNQTIASGAWQKMRLVTVDYDTQTEFVPWNGGDPGNTGRYVTAIAGKYLIAGITHISGLADGRFLHAGIYVNGALYTLARFMASAAADAYAFATSVANLVATDFVELYIYHNHGGNRTAGAVQYANEITIQKVG